MMGLRIQRIFATCRARGLKPSLPYVVFVLMTSIGLTISLCQQGLCALQRFSFACRWLIYFSMDHMLFSKTWPLTKGSIAVFFEFSRRYRNIMTSVWRNKSSLFVSSLANANQMSPLQTKQKSDNCGNACAKHMQRVVVLLQFYGETSDFICIQMWFMFVN